jgi:hypothetical protein
VGAVLVTDLSDIVAKEESSAEKIRNAIANRAYLQAHGVAVIEDYGRILTISEKFRELVTFLTKASQRTLKESAEYKEIEETLEETKKVAERTPDRNRKATLRDRAKTMQRRLDDLTKPQIDQIEPWILEGVQLWINTFMAGRVNLRIYPFPNCPSFQVLCNLKRQCFVDSDPEHLLYGYGGRPNIPLAVFGLITSLPSATGPDFNPMKEFESKVEALALEQAFREMLGALETIEAVMRFSRYPNVTVHPIAVYRSFSQKDSK